MEVCPTFHPLNKCTWHTLCIARHAQGSAFVWLQRCYFHWVMKDHLLPLAFSLIILCCFLWIYFVFLVCPPITQLHILYWWARSFLSGPPHASASFSCGNRPSVWLLPRPGHAVFFLGIFFDLFLHSGSCFQISHHLSWITISSLVSSTDFLRKSPGEIFATFWMSWNA